MIEEYLVSLPGSFGVWVYAAAQQEGPVALAVSDGGVGVMGLGCSCLGSLSFSEGAPLWVAVWR